MQNMFFLNRFNLADVVGQSDNRLRERIGPAGLGIEYRLTLMHPQFNVDDLLENESLMGLFKPPHGSGASALIAALAIEKVGNTEDGLLLGSWSRWERYFTHPMRFTRRVLAIEDPEIIRIGSSYDPS